MEELHEKIEEDKELFTNHFIKIIDSSKTINLSRSTVKNISKGSPIATASMGNITVIGTGVSLKFINIQSNL
jgi:hypothetical protein